MVAATQPGKHVAVVRNSPWKKMSHSHTHEAETSKTLCSNGRVEVGEYTRRDYLTRNTGNGHARTDLPQAELQIFPKFIANSRSTFPRSCAALLSSNTWRHQGTEVPLARNDQSASRFWVLMIVPREMIGPSLLLVRSNH